MICTPYLNVPQIKRFLSVVSPKVKVTVVTDTEGSFQSEAWKKICAAAKISQEHGVQIENRAQAYQRFVVIDEELLRYGGVNFLGFEKMQCGTKRLHSPELAKELMVRNAE